MASADTRFGTDPLAGRAFILALNAALETLATCFYGSIDPFTADGTRYEVGDGTLWWDTTSSPAILQVRDGTNWVELFKIDGNPGSVLQALLDAKLALAGGTLTGFLTLDADPTSALHAATKQYVDATSRPAPIRFTVQGNASVQNNIQQALVDSDAEITHIMARADTAPVGAALTVRLTRKRSGSGDDSRSVVIADGTNEILTALGTPMALLAQDRIQLDVTTVGTTPGGNDLLVATRETAP